MRSRLQLDVRNLSVGRRHLEKAYEVEAVRCKRASISKHLHSPN